MDDLQNTFEAAFESYSDELFRHASIRLSDRERAMELTQETFMKVWAYTQKGPEDIRDLRPFLYRTLRNLIIDEYRKHKATSLEAMAERNQADVEDYLPPDESNTLEAAIDRHDGARALVALQDLPEPYREAVVMRYVDGLSPQEIAKLIDESENVVSVRVHRGLKKLKALLEPEQGYEPASEK
ncbi:MAG TPA: RNA polymerase sigma factor [Candidatus Paceibacterota bacterium]